MKNKHHFFFKSGNVLYVYWNQTHHCPLILIWTVCASMELGMLAFYSQTRPQTFFTSKSYSETYEMPVVTPSPPINISCRPNQYMIFVHPPYDRALVDIVRHYGWKIVFYVYDTDDGELTRSMCTIQLMEMCSVLFVLFFSYLINHLKSQYLFVES